MTDLIACLRCEGTGVHREILNVAESYYVYHCVYCTGTGRTAANNLYIRCAVCGYAGYPDNGPCASCERIAVKEQEKPMPGTRENTTWWQRLRGEP